MRKKISKIIAGILTLALLVGLCPSNSSVNAMEATMPSAKLPATLEEGTYSVPVRLYTATSTANYAEYSMGDVYVMRTATLEAKDNVLRLTVDFDAGGALNYIGYFASEEDYNAYSTASRPLTEDVQMLLKDSNIKDQDLVIETTPTEITAEGQTINVDSVTSISLNYTTRSPILYMAFGSVGMGSSTQYAKLGFEWEFMELQQDPIPEDPDPEDPDPEDPDPDTPSEIIQTYNAFSEWFKSQNKSQYVASLNNTGSSCGYLDLQNFFAEYDTQVADGSVDETLLKEDMKTAILTAADPTKLVQKNTALVAGQTYDVPVKVYAITTNSFSVPGYDEEFTTIAADESEMAKAIEAKIEKATIQVKNNKNYVTLVIKRMNGETEAAPYLSGISSPNTYSISSQSLKSASDGTGVKYSSAVHETFPNDVGRTTEIYIDSLTYLYDGAGVPFNVSYWTDADTIQLGTQTYEDYFIAFDYDNAAAVGDPEPLDKTELQALYENLSLGNDENGLSDCWNYPDETVEALTTDGYLDNMKAVLEKEGATQTEVDEQYNITMDFLKSSNTLEWTFKNLISQTAALLRKTETYTENSLADLKKDYDYAVEIRDFGTGGSFVLTEKGWNYSNMGEAGENAMDVTFTYMNYLHKKDMLEKDAINRIKASTEALVSYADTTELKELLATAKGMIDTEEEKEVYTINSEKALEEKISAVEEKVNAGKLLQDEADKLKSELQEAIDSLVDRSGLKATIDEGEELAGKTDTYTEESLEIYKEELAKAKELYNSEEEVTKKEIEAQITALEKAEEALISYADTTELKALLTNAKNMIDTDAKKETYTKYSRKVLEAAISTVEGQLDTGKLLQEEADKLKAELQTAVDSLVDRSGLKKAIDEGKELAGKTETYTEASLTIYNDELMKAEDLYESINKVTSTQIEAQIVSLKKAEELLVPISDENLDKDNLADGKYTVTVNLWHATQDKESMGNQALYHTGIITVKDGKYYLTIMGHEVTVGVVTGKLKALQVKPGGTTDEDWVTPESVDSEKEGDYTFEFELTSKGEKEYLPSRIQVEEGTPMGTDWVESRLRISWDTLKKTEEDIKPGDIVDLEPEPDVTGPLYYADGETGVIVQAEEGVFPDGVTIVVKKIGLDIDGVSLALSKYVKQYELYEVTAYNSKGEEVQPDGIVSLTFPIPDSYDTSKLCVYHISDSGSLSLLQGTEDNGSYTIKTSKFSYFALAEKLGTTANKPGNSLLTTTKPTTTTTTTKPAATTTTTKTTTTTPKTTTTTKTTAAKTGDTTETAWMFAAAAAALLVILGTAVKLRRRKR